MKYKLKTTKRNTYKLNIPTHTIDTSNYDITKNLSLFYPQIPKMNTRLPAEPRSPPV